jgi:protein-tyrosine phosphatase
MEGQPRRVCFVCTGNICRSPLAEAVLVAELTRRGVDGRFTVESSGTDAYHVGEPADSRMRSVAAEHGVRIEHRARRFKRTDFDQFDYIFALDAGHHRALTRMATTDDAAGKVLLFRSADPQQDDNDFPDVPDPWYGSMEGFERVYRMVSRTCEVIASRLIEGSM